ncbi:anthranilate synthase component I family protein [Okibacterium fritillariae]|uniref:anthranilate synthase component I family protein n=1 Tax=Okibacterium fritillariae TaxID=123320 RepID=UPI001F42CD3A|nr:anthranilate synthase component I family protein [Okibacterium fritillariae]
MTSAPSSGPEPEPEPEPERWHGVAFGERVVDLADGVSTDCLYDDLFAAHPFSFWLDAGADATDGLSYLGTGDELVVQGDASGIRVNRDSATDDGHVTVVTVVADIGEHFRQRFDGRSEAGGQRPSLGEFAPGWVGFLGYEWRAERSSTTRARSTSSDTVDRENRAAQDAVAVGSIVAGTDTEPRINAARRPVDRVTPEAAFLRVTRLVVVDHAARRASVVWIDGEADEDWADVVLASIERAHGADAHAHAHAHAGADITDTDDGSHTDLAVEAGERAGTAGLAHPEPVWRHGRAAYRALIDRCRASIGRGDAYQLCLTNRIDVPGSFDAVEVFRTLRRTSPTHRGGLLRFGDLALVSASPEKFLGLDRSGRIEVRPIKGTRPRASDAVRDRELVDELRDSPKERAENLMIVDLMRNDVGRVSALGSVSVDTLFDIESYAQVHQLVSTVSGQLADGCDAVDVLASTFPAGSMTGAPKQSAIDILGGLEGAPRGVYAGAFGLVGADGTLDLSMVIRSIVIDAHGASVGAGGGITWSSDAAAEVDEMVLKARAPLSALGASEHPPD